MLDHLPRWRDRPPWVDVTWGVIVGLSLACGCVLSTGQIFLGVDARNDVADLLESPTTVTEPAEVIHVDQRSRARDPLPPKYYVVVRLESGEELRRRWATAGQDDFWIGDMVSVIHDEGNPQWYMTNPRNGVSTLSDVRDGPLRGAIFSTVICGFFALLMLWGGIWVLKGHRPPRWDARRRRRRSRAVDDDR